MTYEEREAFYRKLEENYPRPVMAAVKAVLKFQDDLDLIGGGAGYHPQYYLDDLVRVVRDAVGESL